MAFKCLQCQSTSTALARKAQVPGGSACGPDASLHAAAMVVKTCTSAPSPSPPPQPQGYVLKHVDQLRKRNAHVNAHVNKYSVMHQIKIWTFEGLWSPKSNCEIERVGRCWDAHQWIMTQESLLHGWINRYAANSNTPVLAIRNLPHVYATKTAAVLQARDLSNLLFCL